MLIERQPKMLRPERVPAAEWILADACELASLEEADVANCDVVVAATGDDKVNLVVSLLAKTEFAVPRVVARVNRAENEWLFTEQWGVDVAVSKPRLMAALVEEAVSVGDLVRLMTFRQGEANLVEITLPPSAPYVGQPVREVPLPRDSALVAILRGKRVLVPTPGRPAGGRRRADLRVHGRGGGRGARGGPRPGQPAALSLPVLAVELTSPRISRSLRRPRSSAISVQQERATRTPRSTGRPGSHGSRERSPPSQPRGDAANVVPAA